MTQGELATVETQLGVTLPDHYRRSLLEYPPALIDTTLDLGWTQEARAERQLYNKPARLIELNRGVRCPGTPWVGQTGELVRDLQRRYGSLVL